MTGAEHYLKAEQLIDAAQFDTDISTDERRNMIVGAHVHALLAVAAAQADPFAEADWKRVLR